jgi:small subunit ribosomal protein S19
MARSLWKGPFVDSYLLKKSNKILNRSGPSQSEIPGGKHVSNPGATSQKISGPKASLGPIRVWSRRSFILPEFIDQFFEIHNGKQFISFQVSEDMVGHKFGEFASTRKKTLHKKKIKGKA